MRCEEQFVCYSGLVQGDSKRLKRKNENIIDRDKIFSNLSRSVHTSTYYDILPGWMPQSFHVGKPSARVVIVEDWSDHVHWVLFQLAGIKYPEVIKSNESRVCERFHWHDNSFAQSARALNHNKPFVPSSGETTPLLAKLKNRIQHRQKVLRVYNNLKKTFRV